MSGAHEAPRKRSAAQTAVIIFAGWVIACVLVAVFVPVMLTIMAYQATARKARAQATFQRFASLARGAR